MATTNYSTGKILGGALGGAMAARVIDEAFPTMKYEFTALGRPFTIRASVVGAVLLAGAVVAGVDVPGESILVPMAAGAIAFGAGVEVGDDVAALILGLPAPGAPVTDVPSPPPVLPPASPYMYPYGQMSDAYLQQAMGVLRG